MRSTMILVSALLVIGMAYAAIDDIGGVAHGGEGVRTFGLDAGGKGGAGYGGRKGGVRTSGYDRGFSYGTGHDTAKSVSAGDEEIGGKGFGDQGMREFARSGLGYGGLGYGGFRVPLYLF